MTIFVIGFIGIMIFTGCIGIGTLIFVSLDSYNPQPTDSAKQSVGNRYDVIRQVNTNTIETVDPQGQIQHWQRTGMQKSPST
ncbi:MAG: hypothetical protein WBC91_21970 [Phototrophicaceae bacterium]